MFPALGKGEKVAYKYIAPLIEERQKLLQQLGENDQKPVSNLKNFIDCTVRLNPMAH